MPPKNKQKNLCQETWCICFLYTTLIKPNYLYYLLLPWCISFEELLYTSSTYRCRDEIASLYICRSLLHIWCNTCRHAFDQDVTSHAPTKHNVLFPKHIHSMFIAAQVLPHIMPSTSSRNPNPHQQNTTSHPLSHKHAPTETTQSSHTFFRSIAVPSSTDDVIRVPRCHPQEHTLRLVTTTSLCTGCNETMFFSSYTLSGLQQSAKTYDHPGLLFHIMVFRKYIFFVTTRRHEFFSGGSLSGGQQSAKTYDQPGLLFHIMVSSFQVAVFLGGRSPQRHTTTQDFCFTSRSFIWKPQVWRLRYASCNANNMTS